MFAPPYVLFLILHECSTHFHALETGRLLHHRTSRPCPLVLCLVLCPPLQSEPGVSGMACVFVSSAWRCLLLWPSADASCLLTSTTSPVDVRMGPVSSLCPLVAIPFLHPILLPLRSALNMPPWRCLGLAPWRGRWAGSHAVLASCAPRRKADCLGPREVGSH